MFIERDEPGHLKNANYDYADSGDIRKSRMKTNFFRQNEIELIEADAAHSHGYSTGMVRKENLYTKYLSDAISIVHHLPKLPNLSVDDRAELKKREEKNGVSSSASKNQVSFDQKEYHKANFGLLSNRKVGRGKEESGSVVARSSLSSDFSQTFQIESTTKGAVVATSQNKTPTGLLRHGWSAEAVMMNKKSIPVVSAIAHKQGQIFKEGYVLGRNGQLALEID
jgi:hypothetical protein